MERNRVDVGIELSNLWNRCDLRISAGCNRIGPYPIFIHISKRKLVSSAVKRPMATMKERQSFLAKTVLFFLGHVATISYLPRITRLWVKVPTPKPYLPKKEEKKTTHTHTLDISTKWVNVLCSNETKVELFIS